MTCKLNSGDRVQTHTGTFYTIEKCIGSGGQGTVFSAYGAGKRVAIKWYHSHMATDSQKEKIGKLVALGSPSPQFLWPKELISSRKVEGFGYSMPLRSDRYKGIVDLMKRKIDISFSKLIRCALQVVDNFEKLHKKNLCYQDISFGNLFVDEKTGNVLICDNDNIAWTQKLESSVLGTPRFMAPEIVRGETNPNVMTDLFSLAVLLFYMFMIHHPLEGRLESQIRCFDLPAMERLYGRRPIFIFDPVNKENRPVEGIHDNAIVFWQLYPQSFKRAFIHSFTTGLKANSGSRLTEAQWRRTLMGLSDSLVTCECGAQNFSEYTYNFSGVQKNCWACKRSISSLSWLEVGTRHIALEPSKEIYMEGDKSKIGKTILAGTVVKNPHLENVLGITNQSEKPWQVKLKGNRMATVKKNQTVNIERIEEIYFADNKIGRIC